MRLRVLAGLLLFLFTLSWAVALPYKPKQEQPNSPVIQSNSFPITGARVDRVEVNQALHTATVTIHNISDSPITAFDLVIHSSADKQLDMSDASFLLEDLLLGISAGKLEGIRPGDTFTWSSMM